MNMIALVDEVYGLGANGNLLYKVKEDMKYFKEKTSSKIVVMGRNTFDSLPKGALPNRTNIVLTSDKTFSPDDAIVVHNYQGLLKEIRKYPSDDVFIIGGASLYAELMNRCDTVYLNRLHVSKYSVNEIDAFFPKFSFDWKLVASKSQVVDYQVISSKEEGQAELSFMVFKRTDLIKKGSREAHQPTLQPVTWTANTFFEPLDSETKNLFKPAT